MPRQPFHHHPPIDTQFTLGHLATLACNLEVAAPKPGNVHRGADFEDMTLQDFLISATLLGNTIDTSTSLRPGQIILEAIKQTRKVVGTNTNLGITLLMVPLAVAWHRTGELSTRVVQSVLKKLDEDDAADVFQAIRVASPGGLDRRDVPTSQDVKVNESPRDLIEAMRIASKHDLIATQYTNGFQQVLEFVVPLLSNWSRHADSLSEAIVITHIECMARYPDSLIARKCGLPVAEQASSMAHACLLNLDTENNRPTESFWQQVAGLDFWLRADGNRRNPGTTADLIAAGIFAGLLNKQLSIDL